MNNPKKLPCPTCGKPIFWSEEFPYRPFCSRRCQLIDLGEWANESYRVPASDENQEKDGWEK